MTFHAFQYLDCKISEGMARAVEMCCHWFVDSNAFDVIAMTIETDVESLTYILHVAHLTFNDVDDIIIGLTSGCGLYIESLTCSVLRTVVPVYIC